MELLIFDCDGVLVDSEAIAEAGVWQVPSSFFPPSQRDGLVSGFAISQRARHLTRPNRVRHPMDRQFASGCFLPRLATAQLPSATGPWLTPMRILTALCARLHERTGREFIPDSEGTGSSLVARRSSLVARSS